MDSSIENPILLANFSRHNSDFGGQLKLGPNKVHLRKFEAEISRATGADHDLDRAI